MFLAGLLIAFFFFFNVATVRVADHNWNSDIIWSKNQENCRGQKDVVYMDELHKSRICIPDARIFLACASLLLFLKWMWKWYCFLIICGKCSVQIWARTLCALKGIFVLFCLLWSNPRRVSQLKPQLLASTSCMTCCSYIVLLSHAVSSELLTV